MTEDNRKRNIELELEKVGEAVREADLLFANGLLSGAVSRLYYAVLHAVRALLLTKGIEARSHEGALRLLGLHFVKSGVFETRFSHFFSMLMKLREEADYNPAYTFSGEDFEDFRRKASDLLETVREHLRAEGFLSAGD